MVLAWTDAEVTVQAEDSRPSHVIVSVEHGNEPLEIVRERVATELASLLKTRSLEVNPTGPREQRDWQDRRDHPPRSFSVWISGSV